jgi:hypothetical protein
MITYTTPTQQAMARIATAPVTSDQARPTPTPSTRLSLAACPTPDRCPEPCQTCTTVARTALAQPEPEVVGPSDEELLRIAASSIDPYESCGIAIGEYEAETESAVEVYGSELIAYARALLQRYATPQPSPVPVADLAQALQRIARHGPIMGSTGDYRQGQLDILENVQRIATDALNALPVPGAEVG